VSESAGPAVAVERVAKAGTIPSDQTSATARVYLSAEQLSELTPWSVQALNAMRKRGTLRLGVHYFQPAGRGSQVLYKWEAMRAFIEARDAHHAGRVDPEASDVVRLSATRSVIRLANGARIDVEEAARAATRLRP
jgi:hypothetical protein